MTFSPNEPGPFAPPSGALPPVPRAPIPPAPLPSSNQPIGDRALLATPPPPPPPRRRWLVPVIVGGALAAIGLVVGVVVGALALATAVAPPLIPDSAPVGELDDLLEGDPGSPVAVDPLDCDACFGIDDAEALALPDAAYADIGLPYRDGEAYRLTAAQEQIEQTKWWKAEGGTPDSCYFSYPQAPLFSVPGAADDPVAGDDPLSYPAWHRDENEYYFLTEGIRVFDDSAAAIAHVRALEPAISGCPHYALTESGWSTVVTAAPALERPDSVAAYGWAESGGQTRYYAFDLQRGNIVVRLTLASDPGGPTESQFRELVGAYAVALAGLDPVG